MNRTPPPGRDAYRAWRTIPTRHRVGLFTHALAAPAAEGGFTHVYVDRRGRRPVALPAIWRAALATPVHPA